MNFVQQTTNYVNTYNNLPAFEQNLQALKHVAYGAWAVSGIAITNYAMMDYLPTGIVKIGFVSIATISFVGGTYLIFKREDIKNNTINENFKAVTKPIIEVFTTLKNGTISLANWVLDSPENIQHNENYKKALEECKNQ